MEARSFFERNEPKRYVGVRRAAEASPHSNILPLAISGLKTLSKHSACYLICAWYLTSVSSQARVVTCKAELSGARCR